MIIGVMGQARAGKDTLAEYLARHHDFKRVGLADPLKRYCKEVFNFTDEQLWGQSRDEPDRRYLRGEKVVGRVLHSKVPYIEGGETLVMKEYLTPRYALQRLGTEWGRDCYNNVWIDYGIRVSQKLLSEPFARYAADEGLYYGASRIPTIGVVFSDLRFRNEFDAVKKANGFMVRVKREGMTGQVGIAGHASEEEQKTIKDEEFDLVLRNPEGLENYFAVIKKELVPRIVR